MMCFIKKSRALLFGLHANPCDFFQAFCISIGYAFTISFFTDSGNTIGFLINLLLFAFVGAAVKQSSSVYCNLAISKKDKVGEIYRIFAFIIFLILLGKIILGLSWNLMLMRYIGENLFDFLSIDEPEVRKLHILSAYGFFISVGFEFLLFPLLFISRKKRQFLYFMKAALFPVLPAMVLLIIRLMTPRTTKENGYGFLYLSEAFMSFSEKVLFAVLFYSIIFMVVSIGLSYKIAWKQYEKDTSERTYRVEPKGKKELKRRRILIAAIVAGMLCFTGVMLILFSTAKELGTVRSHDVAGIQLTEDASFGPMEMGRVVYMPTTYKPELKKEKEQGLFLYKGENANDILYGLFFSNYAYTDEMDENKIYCTVRGSDIHYYVRADYMENTFELKNYKKAVILDPDFLDKQAREVIGSRVGIHDLDLSVLNNLEEMFGKVKYQPEDFAQIDSYFPILGTREVFDNEDFMSEAEYYLNNSEVIGCIMVRSGVYYYGNLNNPIPKEMLAGLF